MVTTHHHQRMMAMSHGPTVVVLYFIQLVKQDGV